MKQNYNELYFSNLVYLANRDGQVTDGELMKLHSIAESLNLSFEFVSTTLKSSPDIQFINPPTHRAKIEMLEGYLAVVQSDGKIDPTERDACLTLCRSMGLDDTYFWSAIKEVKVEVA